MCLEHAKKATILDRIVYWFKHRNIAYKVLVKCVGNGLDCGHTLKTPIMHAYVVNNKLTAEENPYFTQIYDGMGDEYTVLEGGAIHCYQTKESATSILNRFKGPPYKVFKIKGHKLIALNNLEIAFQSIKLIEEIQ